MCSQYKNPEAAHHSFPLTSSVLSSFSLTPDFNYYDPMNARRFYSLLAAFPRPFTAGEISSVGLLGRIYLHILKSYLQYTPNTFLDLDKFLLKNPGLVVTNNGLSESISHFPVTSTYHSPSRVSEYLLDSSISGSQRYSFYLSLILILIADENHVLLIRDGVFTDPSLRDSRNFSSFRSAILDFFNDQPEFGQTGKSILDFLREPAAAHPDSLFDQLAYIRRNWAHLLDPDLINELLSGLDRLKEEHSKVFFRGGTPEDPLGYSRASYLSDRDLVRFSADQDWMPRLVLLAKNIYVWLDQLSRSYQHPIFRLDHIPEVEFARLSNWGFTGLWLIGIWERSPASQQIKQACGNPDAVPSAYSLYDYTISESLGGEEGYQSMSNTAAKYNIRLAADMVPNHMGIYSKWVIEHPDRFLSLNHSPYPGYTFNGPDLSQNSRVSIYLEDHYYDQSDASVVFKRVDNNTHQIRYIYHGNDGTSMPWNDTAQLDFSNPSVREAVIQTILHVARNFPIIRFDAAMTLAKKHFQRLWFPEPGTGGAIPTRSDFGLSKIEFDSLMPEEFWREVVDRVNSEVPDTLLLAEAFWMMEGYFVRSLGMHRVYNSAFMHMLRDEDNNKYRDLILKTLKYDPQILKRYVNFMNNPDEDTAISQFGSDGKYFGTCVLMSTLPGLPMFGHGQIEGYSEKYGMEYRRAYYNETPNQHLVERHKREIFPLLHRRYLFAEVDNFFLYDFVSSDNHVNQDVLAYSNRFGSESALVIFHNKWGETSGRIHTSHEVNGSSVPLLQALGFDNLEGDFLLFRDQISGLEYIKPCHSIISNGFEVHLGAYHYHVFLDFKVVSDKDSSYKNLSDILGDSGVFSVNTERLGLIQTPLRKVLIDLFIKAHNLFSAPATDHSLSSLLDLLPNLVSSLNKILPPDLSFDEFIFNKMVSHRLKYLGFHSIDELNTLPHFHPYLTLLSIFLSGASDLIPEEHLKILPFNLFDDINTLSPDGEVDIGFSSLDLSIALYLYSIQSEITLDLPLLVDLWFTDPFVRNYLGVHEFNDLEWFNKESFESFLFVIFAQLIIYIADKSQQVTNPPNKAFDILFEMSEKIINLLSDSEYQVHKFREKAHNLQE